MTAKLKSCDTCRFWKRNSNDGDNKELGSCHRYPKKAISHERYKCGEFQSASTGIEYPDPFFAEDWTL